MPYLDVTDVLVDPDFVDSSLTCKRSALSTDGTGLGQLSTTTIGFAGVVCSDRGLVLDRTAVGERAFGSISIITQFRLRDSGTGATADIVQFNGREYTVTRVDDYSRFGRGFIQAIAELKPLAG
jgi:hypothetical protein